jgi:hypothetical protein
LIGAVASDPDVFVQPVFGTSFAQVMNLPPGGWIDLSAATATCEMYVTSALNQRIADLDDAGRQRVAKAARRMLVPVQKQAAPAAGEGATAALMIREYLKEVG